MSAFKSGLDPKTIREGYDRLGGNPFGILPDSPPKPDWFCDSGGCTFVRRGDGTSTGICPGYCLCY